MMPPLTCAYSATEQQTWHFRDSLPVTRDDEDAAWARVDGSRTWWRDLPPLVTEGDILALRELGKRVHYVYMTGRVNNSNGTFAQTKTWLRLHGLPLGPLVMQGDKAKGVAALGGQAVGVLDDKPAALVALRDAGAPVWAMERPYNAWVGGLKRVDSVAEFAAVMMGTLR
jgi:hypothetical protein